MSIVGILTALTVVTLAWLTGLLLGLHAWNNRRFARTRRRLLPVDPMTEKRAALIVPCKGSDLGLEDNLRALLEQDHRNYEIVFAVESEQDPAVPVIRHAAARFPQVPSRLVVAGRAVNTAQKVHNLLAATAQLGDDVEVLAFADSDIRAQSSWLRALVSRLDRPGVGAITGYRWFIPARNTPANLCLSSINSAAAALLGPGGHYPIWGGSWAICRQLFDAVGIRAAWKGRLTDDLVASRAVRRAGLRVDFEPRSVVASPIHLTWPEALRFLRRQYLIGRLYARRLWLLALTASTIWQVALWGSLAVAVGGWLAGYGYAWLALVNFVGLYALASYRCYLRQDLGRAVPTGSETEHAVARRSDVLWGPAFAAVHWIGMLSSCFGSRVAWRGVCYRTSSDGRVVAVARSGRRGSAPTQPGRTDKKAA